jgi:hypothetical protein
MSARRNLIIAFALGAAYVVLLAFTSWEVGCTRDEGTYFSAAETHSRWFGALLHGDLRRVVDPTFIRDQWSENREHPVLMKALSALSWMALNQRLGLTSQITAWRFPAMLMAGLMIGLTYLFGAIAYRPRVGTLAALALAGLPRLFHDAHLATLDVPIAALQLLVLFAYWRGLRSRRWAILCGVFFGLALATKHNAVFIPLILLAHQGLRFVGARPRPALVPEPLLAMVVLGPLIFFLHWPLLWIEPLGQLAYWLRFHLQHENYPVEYFGRLLVAPPFPWSFPLVMTWVTVPLPTAVLMTWGWLRGLLGEAATSLRRSTAEPDAGDEQRTRLLLVLATFVPIFIIALPSVPIFGGVKHWFTAMPPATLLAAAEADRLFSATRIVRRATLAFTCMAALLLGPSLLGILHAHPYGIAFYNELLGGVRGGARAGMMRNFWGYTARGNLARLNQLAAPGDRVYFHRTTHACCEAYRRDGLLRPDLVEVSDLVGADWVLYEAQRTWVDDEAALWNRWGTRRPVAGVYVDEVPMNLLYRRPRTGP